MRPEFTLIEQAEWKAARNPKQALPEMPPNRTIGDPFPGLLVVLVGAIAGAVAIAATLFF